MSRHIILLKHDSNIARLHRNIPPSFLCQEVSLLYRCSPSAEIDCSQEGIHKVDKNWQYPAKEDPVAIGFVTGICT